VAGIVLRPQQGRQSIPAELSFGDSELGQYSYGFFFGQVECLACLLYKGCSEKVELQSGSGCHDFDYSLGENERKMNNAGRGPLQLQ
jgi:hypothetical protein